MNQADWEGLISCYLKDKGYKEAEQALERVRARDTDASMALSDRLSVHKGVVEQLIETFATSEQPQGYVDALERFSSWIDNSLDVHRGELSKLLHPVFLHTYLALIKRDAPAVAAPLLAWYQRRLVAVEGPLSRVRATELEELKGVAVKQELTRNAFVRQVLSGKQTVRLSPYAKELLMHYLHSQKNMLCLASIINQYIKIEEVTDLPKVAQEEEEEEEVEADDDDGSADRADAEAANVNTASVNLGLLKGNVEDRHVDALEQKAQEENKPAAGQADVAAAAGDGSKAGDKDKAKEPASGAAGAAAAEGAAPAPKKAKKDAKAGADVAAAAPVGTVVRLHPGERVDPQPWTPVLTEGVANAWLKDIQLRADVGPSALPSCCFFTFANTRQTLNCAAFTLAADKVAAGFADSSVRLYDLTARRPSSRLAGDAGASSKGGGASKGPGATTQLDADEEEPPGVSYMYGHTGPVHATCFSHDQRVLFSGSADGTVRAWSADQGHALTSYKGHLLPVWDVAAGPLGYHFVSGGADRTARVWATDSARMIRIMAGHQADVDVVGWHPNCMYVATASTDRSVRLWDVATGRCVRFLTGLASAPTCMAVHPDGKHIAVGSDRGSILVWDMGSARRLASFKAHMGPVWSLAYSKGQGSLLASGGADETVRLWSTQAAMPSGDTTAGAGASAKAEPSKGPDGAAAKKPYSQLLTCHTKSSSVTQLQFSNRNLLLAAGAFNLKQRRT